MDPGVLIAVVVVVAIASRPVDVWLWHRGRISDRAAAIALIGRFPVVVFLVALIGGMPRLVIAGITIPLLLISRLLYPFTPTLMDDTRRKELGLRDEENAPPSS